jgi:hypothetical protein
MSDLNASIKTLLWRSTVERLVGGEELAEAINHIVGELLRLRALEEAWKLREKNVDK